MNACFLCEQVYLDVYDFGLGPAEEDGIRNEVYHGQRDSTGENREGRSGVGQLQPLGAIRLIQEREQVFLVSCFLDR